MTLTIPAPANIDRPPFNPVPRLVFAKRRPAGSTPPAKNLQEGEA